MRVLKNRWLISFLQGLAEFLNSDFRNTWESRNNRYREFQGQEGLDQLENLQREIRSLIEPVVRNTDFFYALHDLIDTINEAQLARTLRFRPANKKTAQLADLKYRPLAPAEDRKFIQIHSTKWAIDRLPMTRNSRSYLLSIIEAALVEGELTRLRVCRCRKYFAAKDTKRTFHTDDCKVAYWNAEHKRSGYRKKIRSMRNKAKRKPL